MEFSTKLNALRSRVEEGLDQLLPPADTRPERLHQAMRYSLEAGGKRLRPVLLLAAHEIFQAEADPLPAAVAVECLHTYSLIHDDLPCMDDDDLRRGVPTCHRQYDEATATLAGDALLTHAFHVLATHYAGQPALSVALAGVLGEAAGSRHLIGGQMEDILAEQAAPHPAALEFIHLNKTAALISAALVMGGHVGGADPSNSSLLRQIGRHLGLAFQITDDVLDATGSAATLGKTAGKDAAARKLTYVSVFGIEEARQAAAEHTATAIESSLQLNGDAGFLVDLIRSLEHRLK